MATRYAPAQLARLLGVAEPTAEQAAVIAATPGPMAVIAGAGSGKSETMAARLVWLVANGLVRPERVLGLTFTRKAAAELAERVRVRLDGLRAAGLAGNGAGLAGNGAGFAGNGAGFAAAGTAAAGFAAAGTGASGTAGPQAADDLLGDPVVSTYHAYAGRLVADNALREALEPSLRLITPAVAWQLAARVVASYDGPMDAISWTPASVTAAVLDLSGELAEHLRGPDDVRSSGEWLARRYGELPRPGALARKIIDCQRTREQLLPLVAAYTAAKASREVIDYGDQVALAARIAAAHPEVGAAERARYQVVLLDEYQDTSHAQLVLLRALFGGGHPVTAVGDPCQSIYGWRGASAGNLLRFAADFPPRGGGPAPVRLLSTSFRNTGRVLDAAAALQAGLRAAAPGVPRLVAPPGRAGRGQVVCALLETAADEAAWIAGQIARLLSLPAGTAPDGAAWPDGREDPVRPSDIAVLCRKRAQFPALRTALEARGIPVEVVGLGGLLTVPEVQDVVATLRVMHDPGAADALARLLTGPRWRIGPRDLVALGRRARRLASQVTGPGRREEGQRPVSDLDVMSQAVTDFTADPGSLVEALDDLGEPAAYSAAGYGRLAALAAELRALRGHASRPLPELVGEVERALGLDIEVASRPGGDLATSRADLDAFADAAAAFAGDLQEPTLGAFLAYLAAAEDQEFGLEAGRVGAADSVKLATVHAAKGLQWAAVIVPGLADGAQAHMFPARPRVTTRWTENPRLLPFGLRGDTADLPGLAGLDGESLSDFADACGERDLAEERRLSYVAATRAAFWLACTGYWWGSGTSALGPSVFLAEIRAACESGAGTVAHWAPEPEPGAENPALAEPAAALWPATAAGARYEAARAAGALVDEAIAAASAPASTTSNASAATSNASAATSNASAATSNASSAATSASAAAATSATSAAAATSATSAAATSNAAAAATSATSTSTSASATSATAADGDDDSGADRLSDADQALIVAWSRDTSLLLAEREQRRGEQVTSVVLPQRIPVSSLVTIARDPAEYAQQVRRPMPRPPAPHAHRGTAFHRWLEERFGPQPLLDPGDLPGAADDEPGEVADPELTALMQRFEAGEWAGRWPSEVEVPFETLIGGRLVRGRIDAVFADSPGGGFDVVDWKTGRQPRSATESRAAAVQLAAYRIAWAGLAGVSVGQVRAAFYYVRDDVTVRPADLLDLAGLTALIEDIPLAR
jgi:DNA helicase-2/ATP-dependent DNA helicase PcrA